MQYARYMQSTNILLNVYVYIYISMCVIFYILSAKIATSTDRDSENMGWHSYIDWNARLQTANQSYIRLVSYEECFIFAYFYRLMRLAMDACKSKFYLFHSSSSSIEQWGLCIHIYLITSL